MQKPVQFSALEPFLISETHVAFLYISFENLLWEHVMRLTRSGEKNV